MRKVMVMIAKDEDNIVKEYNDGYKWVQETKNKAIFFLVKGKKKFVKIACNIENKEITSINPTKNAIKNPVMGRLTGEEYVPVKYRKYVTDFLNNRYTGCDIKDGYVFDVGGYIKKGRTYYDIFDLPEGFTYNGTLYLIDDGGDVRNIKLPNNLKLDELHIYDIDNLKLPKGLVLNELHISGCDVNVPKDAKIKKIVQ